ncbi:MAG: LpxD N-terminal domain-containing protein [Leucobacter sp.]
MDAEFHGADIEITSPATIADAEAGTLCFATDPVKYSEAIEHALSRGSVVLTPHGEIPLAVGTGASIQVNNPRADFARVLRHFFDTRPEPGIAASSRVHPTADVHPTAYIGEFTVIRSGAVIGAHSEIRDHVVIARNVRIGEHALIKSHAVVGEEGFGMEKDEAGNNFRIPHLGAVKIGDHAEVGCFTTVCAGTVSPTVVGDYTKIDDHVHVAHNCRIERNVIITACAEVSGSVVLEDEVWLGPNSSIIQGVTLGRGALLGIGAVAVKSVPADAIHVGNPAKPLPPKKP